MAADARPDPDDWPDEPDRWAEADRAWQDKWSDDPAGDEPEDDASAEEAVAPYTEPRRPATASGVGRAYGTGMREAGPYLGLGIQIAASMALFVGGGIALDRWAGTEPWGVLIGAALGLASVLAMLVRLVKLMDAGDPTRTAPPKNGERPTGSA